MLICINAFRFSHRPDRMRIALPGECHEISVYPGSHILRYGGRVAALYRCAADSPLRPFPIEIKKRDGGGEHLSRFRSIEVNSQRPESSRLCAWWTVGYLEQRSLPQRRD